MFFKSIQKEMNAKQFGFYFLILFLPIFMFGIFGPTEIFFGNYSELGFVYGEFGWKFLICGVLLSFVLTFIFLFLPDMIRKPLLALIWGSSIAGYIQVMFLNKGIDQIGVTAEGYIPDTATSLKNGIFWIIMLVIALVITYLAKSVWKKILIITSGILLGVQLVGYISLFITADSNAFHYAEGEPCLSSEKQYTVSSKDNVILFVLDTFSNYFLDTALAMYPDLTTGMNDFTYYNNADCNYYGTYPSLAHMLTGHELDTTQSVDDYLYSCWNNTTTDDYYNLLKSHNYTVNLYTPLTDLLTGTNSVDIMSGKIDNITTADSNRVIDYKKLYKTMLTMSCYRFVPEYFKPNYDVKNEQYESIVSYPENEIQYSNPNFYNNLVATKLSADDSSNYFTIQHLNGTHEFINDENCQYDYDNATIESTVKGIFTMIYEYLDQLKALGVYDNATIIITADHGQERNSQVVFFIKEPLETHDTLQVTNAPITLNELVPSIVESIGEDYSEFGQSIHDFTPDQKRERTVYVRAKDLGFPSVKKFDSDAEGGANIYRTYTYTGTLNDLTTLYDTYSFGVIPMIDSYF